MSTTVYATFDTVTTDSMFGAAGMLSREWGDYGYRIGIQIRDTNGGAVYGCRCSDGSEFFIYSDRWGNARQIEPTDRGTFSLLDEPKEN